MAAIMWEQKASCPADVVSVVAVVAEGVVEGVVEVVVEGVVEGERLVGQYE